MLTGVSPTKITVKNYRELTGVIIRTALRDLEDLYCKGVLNKVGTTGSSIHYVDNRGVHKCINNYYKAQLNKFSI